MKKNIVIFDIDGCLADDRRRRPLLAKSYDDYHRDSADDSPVNSDVLEREAKTPGTRIVFLTARPEKWRGQTADWLLRNFQFLDITRVTLIMRGDSDNRGSVVLKSGVIKGIGAKNIRKLYDDRADIVAAARALGVDAEVLSIKSDVAGILRSMANTFDERSVNYKNGHDILSDVIGVIYPDGMKKELMATPRFYFFFMIMTKAIRLVTTELSHADSAHDIGVYAAMLETEILKGER